ncbi:GPP34 family phosphoprotein [Dactylosporangium sp. CS-047395]|uniref:GPP34 family phosphoprotein n=1 Tax=Dactylosporangium sp. CS-047395 TaxID=3239936 RepID=UPI003D8D9632
MRAQAGVWQAPIRPADDVWLIAHEGRDWRCRLHPKALGLALAGGLLGELVLGGRVAVGVDDMVAVQDVGPPHDAFAHVMLAYIRSERMLDVRTWLKFFAGEKAAALVVERLHLAGLVEDVGGSRMRRHTGRALVPTDPDAAGWRPVRLRHVILGDLPTMPAPTWADITLAGLVQAIGLLPVVFWEDHAAGDAWLRQRIDESAPADLRRLFAAVQTLAGDVVLSGQR